MNHDVIIQVLSSGLLAGASYALIAIGFTLIFGVMNVVNFAHGHLVMLAMYGSYCLYAYLGINPYVSILVLVPAAVVLGQLIYRSTISGLVEAPPAAQMLATIGLLIIIENAANLAFGGDMRAVRVATHSIVVGGVALPVTRLIALSGSLAAIFAVWALLRFARIGREIRAAASNRIGAIVVGIRVDAVYRNVFVLSVCTAALAGALIIPFSLVNPFVGHSFMLKSFIVAIAGGLGSLPGALVAGIAVGLLEAAGNFYLNASLASALVFMLLIVVLLVRPAGLMGRMPA